METSRWGDARRARVWVFLLVSGWLNGQVDWWRERRVFEVMRGGIVFENGAVEDVALVAVGEGVVGCGCGVDVAVGECVEKDEESGEGAGGEDFFEEFGGEVE